MVTRWATVKIYILFAIELYHYNFQFTSALQKSTSNCHKFQAQSTTTIWLQSSESPMLCTPNEVPSELTTHHYLTRIIVTFFNWSLLPSIGTPTTQVHDFPKRLLWLLHFLISQFVWNHCRSWRRKALGLSIRPQIVLGMLLCRSYDKIPPTDPLIFHGFHNSNTHCHNSFSCWTHFPLFTRLLFVLTIGSKEL